jgi:dTDP-glucose 4,6-dehydratase
VRKVLLTGGCGFAGAHIVEHLLANTDWEIVVLDRLSYAGTLERLTHLRSPRLRFVFHDFRAAFPDVVLKKLAGVDFIIHNGAETHVETSLHDPESFVQANVVGTLHVLEAARKLNVSRFLYVSTDEVHGPAPTGVDFTEDAPIKPSNPYSAAKAGGEALTFAYWKSYKLPVIITRTMNLFGERQHPEKFVPMTIRKVMDGELVTVHGTSDGRIGSRKWLHARNQADALLFLLRNGLTGETYHIAGEEYTNLEIAQFIAATIGRKLSYEIVDFHSQRPGHDLRYSLSDAKLRAMGWQPPMEFGESMGRTVRWAMENPEWIGKELEYVG